MYGCTCEYQSRFYYQLFVPINAQSLPGVAYPVTLLRRTVFDDEDTHKFKEESRILLHRYGVLLHIFDEVVTLS